MKILIVSPSYEPAYVYGGTSFSVPALARALARAGANVDVYCTNANGKGRLEKSFFADRSQSNLTVTAFHSNIPRNIHLSFSLLFALISKARRYDVILIQSWWNLVAIFSCIIAISTGKKVWLSPRGMLSEYTLSNSTSKRLFHRLIGNFLLRRVSLHATSTREQEQLHNLNQHYKVVVMPNLIDERWYKESLLIKKNEGLKDTPLKLLFLSRIDPKKGLSDLLRAMTICTDVVLDVVGFGQSDYVQSLRELAEHLGVADRIKWHPPTYAYNDKLRLYSNADLFVLPSKDENFANGVLEAMLCNLPVLVSFEVGLAKFIEQHGLGFVWSREQPLSDTLQLAISEKRMGLLNKRAAAMTVRTAFDQSATVTQYLKNLSE